MAVDINKRGMRGQIRKHIPLSLFVKGAKETSEGYRYSCPLPGHSDPANQFYISSKNNLFYCYGCMRGGDIFAFLRITLGFSFLEVVERYWKHNPFDGEENPDAGKVGGES